LIDPVNIRALSFCQTPVKGGIKLGAGAKFLLILICINAYLIVVIIIIVAGTRVAYGYFGIQVDMWLII